MVSISKLRTIHMLGKQEVERHAEWLSIPPLPSCSTSDSGQWAKIFNSNTSRCSMNRGTLQLCFYYYPCSMNASYDDSTLFCIIDNM